MSTTKTPVELAIEALEQGKLCANVAYNLGQNREDSESILGTVRKFDDLRLAALSSLKSMEPRLTLQDFDDCVAEEVQRVSHIEYNSHEICKHFASKVRERLTQSAKP